MTYIANTATIGSWIDGGALTFTVHSGDNITKPASPVIDKVYYRRVGDTMIARYSYYQTSAGTEGAVGGTVLLTIPGGYSIDTDRGSLPSSSVGYTASPIGRGSVIITFGGINYFYEINAYPYSATKFWMQTRQSSQSSGTYGEFTSTNNFIESNPFYFSLEIDVPIVGW